MVSKELLIEKINKDQTVQARLRNIANVVKRDYEEIVNVFCETYLNPNVTSTGSRKEAILSCLEFQAHNPPTEIDRDYPEYDPEEEEKRIRQNDLDKIEQTKLKRICVSGLPNYNFARLFMVHMGGGMIHPEINYSNGLAGLSAITLGRVRAKTKNIRDDFYKKTLRVNTYNVVVAGSGDGKTESFDAMVEIINPVMGLEIYAEKGTSPETLAKNLASEQIERKLEKEEVLDEDGEPTGEKLMVLNEYHVNRSTDSGIHPGWKVYWHSEFGGTLANMTKPYMAGIKETMCELFSCSEYQKANSSDKQGETITFRITDPCFSMNGCCTTEGIKKLTIDDQISGFELRLDEMYAPFPVLIPDKTKAVERKDIDPKNILSTLDQERHESGLELENIQKQAMIKAAMIINTLLKDQIIEAEFLDESIQLIINHEIAMRNHFADDTYKTLLASRNLEKIYKHSILLTIGNLPYYVLKCQNFEGVVGEKIDIHGTFEDVPDLPELFNQLAQFDISKIENIRLSRLPIMPEMVRFALKMYDRIYFPGKLAISEIIGVSVEKTDVIKVREIMENAPRISKADVLKGLRYVADMSESYLSWRARPDGDYKPIPKNVEIFLESKYIKHLKENSPIVDYEKLIEETRENMEMVEVMSDDAKITHMLHRDLSRQSGLYDIQLRSVLRTITGIRNIMTYPKSKASVCHVYFPTSKGAVLPDCEENHTDYVYEGPYPYQLELVHVAPIEKKEKIVRKAKKDNKEEKKEKKIRVKGERKTTPLVTSNVTTQTAEIVASAEQ